MAVGQHAKVAGERVETLLGELRTVAGGRAAGVAEELVGCLVALYGAGLERVVELIVADQEAGPRVLDRLVADPLVESLLLVHDLHPVDTGTRIERALDRIRPYLGSHAGGVEYLGVDEAGVVHLRLEGSCDGCPSSSVTVRLMIEQAITEAAPETTGVDVVGVADAPTGPPLLQIGRRPREREDPVRVGVAAAPARPGRQFGPASGADSGRESGRQSETDGWVVVPVAAAPGDAAMERVTLAGMPVMMCRLGEELYAYRDACRSCGTPLSAGELTGPVLRCTGCGGRYDVRLAGMGLDGSGRHLDPLPLLAGADGISVAAGAMSALAP